MQRAIIIITLILLSFGLKAQVYQAMPQAGYGPVKRFLVDSVLTIPQGITSLRQITGGRDIGQIRWNGSDTGLYIYNGARWQKINIDTTNLANEIAEKLNITDTVSLSNRINLKADKITTLTINGVTYDLSANRSWTVSSSDTVSLSNRINLKLNIADTSAMLSPYLRKLDTIYLSNRIDLKLNASDTASLSNRINKKQDSLILTTIGTTGNATLTGATLNIPSYSTTGFVPYTGATSNVLLGLKSLNGAKLSADTSLQIKNRANSYGNSTFDYTAISADFDNFNFYTIKQVGGQNYQNGALFYYPNGDPINNTKSYYLPVRNGTIALVEDTVNLSTRINLKADKATTLTINGTGYDLSANRSWTIAGVDTTSLSNRINTKLNISDTASMLSNYRSAINTRVKYSDTAAMLDPYLTAAVTSVGLSMPVAFSVANSPITSTGTLAVSAVGTAAQYIRGDGQLATLPTGGGGGSSVNYYLNGSITGSVATYKQMSRTAVIGGGTDIPLAGNGLIAQFITDVNDPNRLEIPAGAWNFEMFFNASSAGGTPAYYIEVLKYNGTTATTIANNSANPEPITSGTLTDLYLTSLAIPYTTLVVTDRLIVRVYIVNSVGGRTITLHTEDNNLCQIVTTFSSGVSSLNGLTANTQYLAVGTSGTDFAINSLTDTHTFNLPTASATNRGALSSTNWSTFNGKMNYSDTTSLSNRINLKLNSSDTTSLSNRINLKLNSSDTTSLSNRINLKQNTLTLTTTGTSGASTLTGATLNIPQYQSAGTYVTSVTGTSPIVSSGGTTPAISIPAASSSVNGYLTSTDWAAFNGKQNAINGTGFVKASGTTISYDNSSYYLASNPNGYTTNTGTVTSIATNLGLTGGTITTSGTLSVDTASASILSRQRAAATYQPIITNPITGTGTTNYISKFTNSTTLGNSLVFDNGTNVGISTTTPLTKLDVNGNARIAGVIITGNPAIPAGVGAALTEGYYAAGNYAFFQGYNYSSFGYIPVYVDGSKVILNSNGGNVSVGSATDDGVNKFQVTGGTKVTGQLTLYSTISNGTYTYTLPSATGTLALTSALSGYLPLSGGTLTGALGGTSATFNGTLATSAGFAINANSGSFAINPSSTRGIVNLGGTTDNFLTFANKGYIGVGSNYMQILAQTGVALSLVSDASTVLSFALSTGAATFSGAVTATQGNFNQTASSGFALTMKNRNANKQFGFGVDVNAVDDGYFQIYDATNSASRLAITSGGNLLVGTTTDNGSKLQVSGGGTISGNVGIGTASPEQLLTVTGGNFTVSGNIGTARQVAIVTTSGGNAIFGSSYQGASSFGSLILQTSGADRLTIASTGAATFSSLGTGTVYSNGGTLTNTNPSDSSLKNSIEPLSYGLNEIMQLKPKTFYYNSDSTKSNLKYGFIAQEVQPIMPNIVRAIGNGSDKLGLESDGINVAMVNAIQELKKEIETLKAEIEKLKK